MVNLIRRVKDVPQHWEAGQRLPGALVQEQDHSGSSEWLQAAGNHLVKEYRDNEGVRIISSTTYNWCFNLHKRSFMAVCGSVIFLNHKK